MDTYLIWYRLQGESVWLPALDADGNQIFTSGGTFEWDASALPAGTYEIRAVGLFSALETTTTIVVAPNRPPAVPTLTMTEIAQGVLHLVSSPFSDPDGADDFQAIRWQLYDQTGSVLIYDSGWLTQRVWEHTITGDLERGVCYLAQVCHLDSCDAMACATALLRTAVWDVCEPPPATDWEICPQVATAWAACAAPPATGWEVCPVAPSSWSGCESAPDTEWSECEPVDKPC